MQKSDDEVMDIQHIMKVTGSGTKPNTSMVRVSLYTGH